MTIVPSCRDLPDAFALDRDYPRAAFERRLDAFGRDAGGWVVVARCRDCGQRWRVDEWDKYQVALAIKAPDAAAWSDADDRAARLEYLRRSRGGEGAAECVWAGCPRRALRGLAYCAEHAYDRAGARA